MVLMSVKYVNCIIDSCDTPASSKGWCKSHYDKWYLYGDPEHIAQPYIKPSQATTYLLEMLQVITDDCMIWPYQIDDKGYGRIKFKGIDSQNLGRVVCEITYGPAPQKGMIAAHGPCHNPSCFNPKHLSWGTYEQNNRVDRYRDNTILIGEKNAAAKLTEEQVIDIRSRYTGARGEISAFAKEFGVSKYPIQALLKGKTWKHLL